MNTMKTIKNVKIIANAERANVIIEVTDSANALFRTPKMMLLDLHQSGRALSIPAKAFDNGYVTCNPIVKAKFMSEVHKLRGATLVGDINVVKAGDNYYNRENVLIGQRAKDGFEVVGFLTIPLTETELYRAERAEAAAAAEVMNNFSVDLALLLGGGADETPVDETMEYDPNVEIIPVDETTEDSEDTDEPVIDEAALEAFGIETPAKTVVKKAATTK